MQTSAKAATLRLVQLTENAILLVIGLATVYAAGLEVLRIVRTGQVGLSDLFLLFIYAEVIGMVGAFYRSHRIPVTLPIIIAMTALCRMIILQSKDIDPVNILFEAGGILILAAAALVMSYKDKLSLEKLNLRREPDDRVD
jgi:protein PsiE